MRCAYVGRESWWSTASQAQPARTPFTRAGTQDAGHLFLYLTNKPVHWSLLLEVQKIDQIYDDAFRLIPMGYSQLWLFEKLYSTRATTDNLLTKK